MAVTPPVDPTRARWLRAKWAQMRTMRPLNVLLTSHLPVAVVREEVQVYLGSWTDPDDERLGITQISVVLGEKVNADLTPDQAEYVVSVLLRQAALLWNRYGDDRPVDLPGDA